MSIDFKDKSFMMSNYELSESQYRSLIGDLEKLTPEKQRELDNNFVISWKSEHAEEKTGADQTLPSLTSPKTDAYSSDHFSSMSAAALPSPGASIMALITEYSAEQKRQNKDLIIQESYAIADQMMEQAQEIKNKAITQLVLGVISGAVSIAQGCITMSKASKAPKMPDNAEINSPELVNHQATSSSYMTQVQALSGALDGAAKGIGSAGQAAGGFFDSTVKEMDAEIEKRRAIVENLRSLSQTYTDVLQKALAAMESLQQGYNQARAKILG